MTLPVSAASLPPPVQLREFEAPLDLLLDEVRRQNVAIRPAQTGGSIWGDINLERHN